MKRFHLYISLALLLFAMVGCDQVQQDQADDNDLPVRLEDDVVYVMPGSPVLIDLLTNDAVIANASFELVTAPTRGTAQLLDNGKCMYRPNSDQTSSGTDKFTYRVTAGNTTSEGEVTINLESDSTNIPCDYLNLQSDYVCVFNADELLNPMYIDVLANDVFCDGDWDLNSLDIEYVTSDPLSVTVDSGIVNYHNGNTINPSSPYVDFFIYSVDRTDVAETGYALVVVEYVPTNDSSGTCITVLPEASDDFLDMDSTVSGTTVCVDILLNDIYCFEEMNWNSISIGSGPSFGSATLSDSLLCYTPGPNFAGQDLITYSFCDLSGNCTTGNVYISGVPSGGGGGGGDTTTCTPVAVDDQFAFSWSEVSTWALSQTEIDSLQDVLDSTSIVIDSGDYVIELPVVANDQQCTNCDWLTISTGSNNVVSVPWLGSAYYVVASGHTGTETFTYDLCNPGNNNCDQANVTVVFTQ